MTKCQHAISTIQVRERFFFILTILLVNISKFDGSVASRLRLTKHNFKRAPSGVLDPAIFSLHPTIVDESALLIARCPTA